MPFPVNFLRSKCTTTRIQGVGVPAVIAMALLQSSLIAERRPTSQRAKGTRRRVPREPRYFYDIPHTPSFQSGESGNPMRRTLHPADSSEWTPKYLACCGPATNGTIAQSSRGAVSCPSTYSNADAIETPRIIGPTDRQKSKSLTDPAIFFGHRALWRIVCEVNLPSSKEEFQIGSRATRRWCLNFRSRISARMYLSWPMYFSWSVRISPPLCGSSAKTWLVVAPTGISGTLLGLSPHISARGWRFWGCLLLPKAFQSFHQKAGQAVVEFAAAPSPV